MTPSLYPTQIRWKQRFENYQKALGWLREAYRLKPVQEFSLLEKQGIIQRFEMCCELGWKVMKDFLDYNNVTIDLIAPREIIKLAFAANLVADGQGWLDLMQDRNLLSHVYDEAQFLAALTRIETRYLALFGALEQILLAQP